MSRGPLLFKDIDTPNLAGLETYRGLGGYEALAGTLGHKTPEECIEIVKASGLRGRGGAGFPAGLKWSFVPKNSTKPKYIVCNADESEPGTFKDRELMVLNPHLLIEGMILAGYAIGSNANGVPNTLGPSMPAARASAMALSTIACTYANSPRK